jgi:hypothetical protein
MEKYAWEWWGNNHQREIANTDNLSEDSYSNYHPQLSVNMTEKYIKIYVCPIYFNCSELSPNAIEV